jgi:hypothetical protein
MLDVEPRTHSGLADAAAAGAAAVLDASTFSADRKNP